MLNECRLIVIAILIVLFTHAGGAEGRVIHVVKDATGTGDSWDNALGTITAGLTAAASGDDVWVKSATYTEAITLKTGVQLYGGFIGSETAEAQRDWAANETIIDATGLNKSTVSGADEATIDGFTITGGHFSGVYCYQSSPRIVNCRITGNESVATSAGGGVFSYDGSSPTLTNCTITNNVSEERGCGGVSCYYNSTATLVNCTLTGNRAANGSGGVRCFFNSTALLTNCILQNRGEEIITDSPASSPVVQYSCVQGGWPGEGNIDALPLFVDPVQGDYRLQNHSPCIDRGLTSAAPATDLLGNPRPGADGLVDMGAYESPDSHTTGSLQHNALKLLVRQDAAPGGDGGSWDTAFQSVMAALEIATTSDEIWVKAGRYAEKVVMEPGVSIYAGFAGTETERGQRDWAANETIIDVTGLWSNAVIGANHAVLDGFIITGATYGKSIHCIGASPKLANCTISGNVGGGITCNYGSSPTLTNCTISGNLSTALSCGDGSSPTLTNCIISDNAPGYGYPVLSFDQSSPVLINCVITGNSTNGIMLSCWMSASPMFTNCTIANNTVSEGGSMVSCNYASSPTFVNCILWNRGTEIATEDAESNPTVRYSCVQGGWPGEGNIDALPLFVDAALGDYRLQDHSPCVDRGLTSAAHATDLLGNPRPGGDGLVDMGAFESPDGYMPGPGQHSSAIIHVGEDASPGGDGQSWNTAFQTITAALDVATSSDEIWVKAGWYTETIHLEPGVSLYGGFAGTETDRAQSDWAVNVAVIDALNVGNRTVIGADRSLMAGFVITGGGVYCNNASPTFTSCNISGNANESTFGGGVSCDFNSSPILNYCLIADNVASYGGGVYCDFNSSPILTNCTISGNTAKSNGGGVGSHYSSPAFTNCVIANNVAMHDGGAAYGDFSGSIALTNCTLTGNSAEQYGGGMFLSMSCVATLLNCIVSNKGAEFYLDSEATLDVQYSCVQGGWPGQGNIDAPPFFVDEANGNYRLQDHSPCIDRGLVSAAPATDAEGNPRPGGDGLVDMGAYESPDAYTPVQPTAQLIFVRSDAPAGGDGRSWDTAFSTLSAALKAAASLDEIWVKGGRYMESILLEADVSLYGGFAGTETFRDERDWVANVTIIDATGTRYSAVTGARSSLLDGFTVTGGSPSYGAGPFLGGGVYCVGASITLRNCIITGNKAVESGGGLYFESSNSVLTNCVITDNSAEHGSGVSCKSGSVLMRNCTIAGNNGYDALLCDSSGPSITSCILWNRGTEIAVRGTRHPTVRYSCVQEIWPGTGNIHTAPRFVDAQNGDYRLQDLSPCVDRAVVTGAPATDAAGNPRPGGDGLVDMGAYESPDHYLPPSAPPAPKRHFVRSEAPGDGDGSSWNTAFNSLTAALDAASASDEIWVKGGRYTEAIALEPGVSLFGGFAGTETALSERDRIANETIIDAAGLKRSVVLGADDSLLDGFTLTGGDATFGGGLYCEYTSPTLANCVITRNNALDAGGGVFIFSATPTLTNCTITRNWASDDGGGLYCRERSAPALLLCTISENRARTGGGIFSRLSFPTLANCVISGNTATLRDGGGVYCAFYSTSTMKNCVITGNKALYGGGVYSYFFSKLNLTNCTINGNTAVTGEGGGAFTLNSSLSLENCILWNEYCDTEIKGAGITCAYSCVRNGWAGNGNISQLPHFAHPWNEGFGDLHLQPDSPCIDAGDPALFDGCLPPGLGTGRSDMGAYGGPENCNWASSLSRASLMLR